MNTHEKTIPKAYTVCTVITLTKIKVDFRVPENDISTFRLRKQ